MVLEYLELNVLSSSSSTFKHCILNYFIQVCPSVIIMAYIDLRKKLVSASTYNVSLTSNTEEKLTILSARSLACSTRTCCGPCPSFATTLSVKRSMGAR